MLYNVQLTETNPIRRINKSLSFKDNSQLIVVGENDDRNLDDLEELVYKPDHDLDDNQLDQLFILGRALDCSSTVRQPSLHMSAAAASRDITLVSHNAII